MACFEGFFHDPTQVPLAEQYLLNPNGGAVASWSPTGFGIATGHDALEQGLFLADFQNNVTILGQASDAGKVYLSTHSPSHLDLLDTFLLFGDPALQIQGWVEPTAVEMADLSAQTEGNGVRVAWTTVKETEILGFHVLRAENVDGLFSAITLEMVQATMPGGSDGYSYSFVDTTADPARNYWYKLQILTLDGGSTEYGLAAVVPNAMNKLFLPSVGR